MLRQYLIAYFDLLIYFKMEKLDIQITHKSPFGACEEITRLLGDLREEVAITISCGTITLRFDAKLHDKIVNLCIRDTLFASEHNRLPMRKKHASSRYGFAHRDP